MAHVFSPGATVVKYFPLLLVPWCIYYDVGQAVRRTNARDCQPVCLL